jgi:hypothetical protein
MWMCSGHADPAVSQRRLEGTEELAASCATSFRTARSFAVSPLVVSRVIFCALATAETNSPADNQSATVWDMRREYIRYKSRVAAEWSRN